jgi:hypothetical protein
MRLDWDHIPLSPSLQPTKDHPFGDDLDLIGQCSLMHLIDVSVTQGGNRRLFGWLMEEAPDPDRVLHRQSLVRELVSQWAFRDRLTLNGALVSQKAGNHWKDDHLIKWLDRHAGGRSLRTSLMILSVMAALNFLLFLLYFLSLAPAYWGVSWLVYLIVYLFMYRRFHRLFEEAYHLEKSVSRFDAVLLYLENHFYEEGSRLAELCGPFWNMQKRPSRCMKKIARIAAAASVQKSELAGLFVNSILPWSLYFMHRLNACKEEIREILPAWLDAWYDLEAVSSLANFAYLNPDYVFPKILPAFSSNDKTIFYAVDLGHPLLGDQERVCNDFHFETLGQIAVITGSNMSGKSVFLKTLGVNLILACAGGAVNARVFQTIPFRLFTCIGVRDSVSEGISYFYAEVRRLKALLDELQKEDSHPLFFLVDEIFRGTNNLERLLGSRAYIRALAANRGVGGISTHDLELVKLADELPSVHNYHFKEEVVDGRMQFDYRLRSGPCPTTNALKIMQLEGLPVETVDKNTLGGKIH